MIGIDVGSTAVTLSDGSSVERDPHRVPAELVCRVGDDVPCVLLRDVGFELRQAHDVYADLVVGGVRKHRAAADLSGSMPVAVAVPGWWTPRALGWVGSSLDAAGFGDVFLVNDGEAAVLGHLVAGGILPGTVAVVDLGAETSSVVIVEQCAGRPTAVPSPALVHVEGGDRLDGAVLHHLVAGLADLGVTVDRDDAETVVAARGVLEQCRDLREMLSQKAVESVEPTLPGAGRRLRLVRSELEELADPWAESVVRMVGTAIDQYPGTVEAVLLVGGLASMPLISQRLSADLGLEVVVADAPADVVARGAATRAVAPEQPPAPRRTWRRALERTERPALSTSPSRRRERGRRRRVDEPARIAPPAIAALPAGSRTRGPDEDVPDLAVPEPAVPDVTVPRTSDEWLDPNGSPAEIPDGSHLAAMVQPVDGGGEPPAVVSTSAGAGR